MYDLFGSEMPLAARFFIAFLVVLALIGLTAWLVRRFGANRLGGAARGRQPRLAVIDAASVDGRRRLVLIRRDNIEHLLMIGGPTDVVIEPNIVRAVGTREARASRPARMTPEARRAQRRPPKAPGRCSRRASRRRSAPPRPYRSTATEEPWLPPEPGARARARRRSHRPRRRTAPPRLNPPEPRKRRRVRAEPRMAPRRRASRRRRRRPITTSPRWRSSSKPRCAARRRRKAARR